MTFELYDYCSADGTNEFKVWTENLQSTPRGKLNQKLDALKQHGDDLFPNMLTGTNTPGILKLRVKGNVQLRPMLCRGPINNGTEYTLLLGAIEVGGKLKPAGADAIANGLKTAVITAPDTRRKKHERVS